MYENDFSDENRPEKVRIGPSKTLQILSLFAHKFLYPTLYPDFDVTEEQFETLLNLMENSITGELEKVEKEVNISSENMNDDMKKQVEDQLDYLIEAGELFLESIEEMRIYLENRAQEPEGREHLLRGIDVARKADKQLRKSLEIFEYLRETN